MVLYMDKYSRTSVSYNVPTELQMVGQVGGPGAFLNAKGMTVFCVIVGELRSVNRGGRFRAQFNEPRM